MAGVEMFGKKDKEARLGQISPGRQREIEGPTIKEILADQSELFGLYLEKEGEGGVELGRKLKSGELGREEFAALNRKRVGFLELMQRSENVGEVLDTAALEEMIEASPDLKELATVNGPDGMHNAMERYLKHMAILDRERFGNMSAWAVKLKESKKIIEEENKGIKKFCDEHDIDVKEYINAIHSGNPNEIVHMVRDNMGFFKKRFTTLQDVRRKLGDFDKSDAIREDLNRLNYHLKGMGKVLAMALMDNEVLHKAFVADINQEEAPKLENGMSFGEVKRPKDEDVDAAWEKYRDAHEDEFMENGVTFEEGVASFSREYTANSMKGKKGFWATIAEEFFGSTVEKGIKERFKGKK